MDYSDPHRVKYFCEAVGFKYHLGYPWRVPRPPNPLPPKIPIGKGGGPIGGPGGHEWGAHIISLTPKCDMFLESP